ncbi:galactokinase [Botrimarina sp.]|uniref:galactokinase n=1 Tax=Botrimarina sp. TaxID=2795802 RepID=UPI0032EDF227
MATWLQTAPPLSQLADHARRLFRERYGAEPQVVAAAPGRVNLIGEHTDYNDGFVLPMAIERHTVVAAARRESGDTARFYSAAMDQQVELPLVGGRRRVPGWAGYLRGVLDAYRREGVAAPALDAVVVSTVPLGGGLSSSAALEVSLALVLEGLTGVAKSPAERALLCQRAEHEGAGVPCGVMDQFSSALCRAGHLMLLDCRSREPRMVPLADGSVAVLITNSNVKHELTGGEYAERRAQCEEAARTLGVAKLRDATPERVAAAEAELGPLPFRRARHVVGENLRTEQAAAAVAQSDWPAAGRLMYASHAAMRDDFEITVPEIDKLVEIAQAIGPAGGVIGSRMTGGGFGGCTVSLVEADKAESVAAALHERYRSATGIEPTCFATRPAAGGRTL